MLVKPGIGGFVPMEGSAIGNTWSKDEVTAVVIVEPSTGGFVPYTTASATSQAAGSTDAGTTSQPAISARSVKSKFLSI